MHCTSCSRRTVRDDPLVVQGHIIFHDTLPIISPSVIRVSITFICFFHKLLWDFFVHFPYSIHGDLGLARPLGPCIINVVMVLCNTGNFSSGISAHTMSSVFWCVCGLLYCHRLSKCVYVVDHISAIPQQR